MKKALNGYMTLEAALIMPMAWFVLFFMIFAGFFQYDRCVAEQDSKIILLRASEMRGKEEAKVIRTVMGSGELAGEKKLLFSDGVTKRLQTKGDSIYMEISGRVNTILKGFEQGENLGVFSYGADYVVKKYDPVHFIRTCRRIEGYGGN